MFAFKQFAVNDVRSAHKVGTDAVLLGAWARLDGSEKSVLDVGTGSGVIALMMAQRSANASVVAVEIDAGSALDARANFEFSPWNGRLFLVEADFRESGERIKKILPAKADLIVSNPPYFTDDLRNPDVRKSAARHTDSLSYDDFLDASAPLLAERGRLAVVLPAEESQEFITKAFDRGLRLHRICRVSTKEGLPPKRCLMEFSSANIPLEEETLAIHETNADGLQDFTPAYKALTRDFYLKF